MITEKDLSKELGREIKSPIRISSVKELDFDHDEFVKYFNPLFESLQKDEYLLRENQFSFLLKCYPDESAELEKLHVSFYKGDSSLELFHSWISRLSDEQSLIFEQKSKHTRARNISSFEIKFEKEEVLIKRIYEDAFKQDVADNRTWTRIFEQATKEAVENVYFQNLLVAVANMVKEIHPEINELKITSHFMRTIAQEKILGENAPEGVHEDGSPYIVSALVINRQNITGGESQIYELKDNIKELIYSKELNPGEFIFQADTGEEKTFGNDLWHYVTPIEVIDKDEIGLRDIIGLDIDIVE